MNPMTYMFWDTETTGLDKAFDVPVEIGALVTDPSLRPIREIDPGLLTARGRAEGTPRSESWDKRSARRSVWSCTGRPANIIGIADQTLLRQSLVSACKHYRI